MSAHPPLPAGWSRDWALFLDIDGTLLELAPTPDAARVPPDLPDVLAALSHRLDGALALVSGRPLQAIDRFFPGEHDAAGCHGAQWRRGGREMPAPPGRDAALVAVAETLRARLGDRPGLLLESKPHALALHYRQAPTLEAAARALVEQALLTLGPNFRMQDGKQVFEILPAEAGKGTAIRRFMAASPYAGRRPVFAGDDLTDEDGFAVVNEMAGITIRIDGGGETQARFRLDTPAALRGWLVNLMAVA